MGARGGPAAPTRCPVHSLPSKYRCPGAPLGSAYQPGGGNDTVTVFSINLDIRPFSLVADLVVDTDVVQRHADADGEPDAPGVVSPCRREIVKTAGIRNVWPVIFW